MPTCAERQVVTEAKLQQPNGLGVSLAMAGSSAQYVAGVRSLTIPPKAYVYPFGGLNPSGSGQELTAGPSAFSPASVSPSLAMDAFDHVVLVGVAREGNGAGVVYVFTG